MAEGTAIAVERLSKRFGRFVALDDVSFEVPGGALFGLLGPNGAGKTTLFSIAANFLQASAGLVRVLGIDVREISKLRGRFSMLPQDALFERNVPVLEQMITFCRLNGESAAQARESSERALALVGLKESMHRAARTLSHGMSKRMALAQAFLGKPEVVLLDEPTAGLDPENAAQIRKLVREMAGSRTVVISSHNLAEIQEMCTHAAILDKGKLRSCGTMAELLGSGYLVRMQLNKDVSDALTQSLKAIREVKALVPQGKAGLEVTLDLSSGRTKDEVLQEILGLLAAQGYIPRSINEGAELEQRFLELVGGKSDGLGST